MRHSSSKIPAITYLFYHSGWAYFQLSAESVTNCIGRKRGKKGMYDSEKDEAGSADTRGTGLNWPVGGG